MMGDGSDDRFNEMSSKFIFFMQITPYKAWEATVV